MIPILYGETETSFISNGLGRLSDAISCVVTEERNGEYELEMDYPVGGAHYSDIQKSRIVSAVPADGKSRQPFRIYRISKPINGIVTIYAEHISYQLSLIPVMPFTAGSAAEAVVAMESNAVGTLPFTLWTDVTTVANYNQRVPKSFRACLGGSQGSFLDTYGGEFEWDNWTVKIHASRGADRWVTIRYGKNLTDLVQEENIQDTYTGILPYWYSEEQETLVTLPEKVIMSSNASLYPFNRVLPYDFSSHFSSQPTEAQLRQAAQSYVTSNNIGVPKVSLKVEFAALWQTEEYKNVANQERVNLCDTVTVKFEKLGVSAKAKVIKTKYNVLLERYDSIEIGDAKSSFSSTFVKAQEETAVQIAEATSGMDKAIAHATELISGGLGGYVYIKPNTNGQPEEILIMDQPDINTAVNVIRMNKNGIAFSTNGYDPANFDTAWTINGAFNASFITAGVLTANLIKAGILSDGTTDSSGNPDPNFVLNMATGAITAKKLSIDSENFDLTESGVLTAKSATLDGANVTGKITNKRSGISYLELDDGYVKYYGITGSSFSPQLKQTDDGTFFKLYSDRAVNYRISNTNYDNIIHYNLLHNIYGSPFNRLSEFLGIQNIAISDHVAFGTKITQTTDTIPEYVILQTDTVEVYGSKYSDGGNLIEVDGGFNVTDSKHRVVETENYGRRALSSVESASYLFSDIGSGQTDENGKAFVFIDPAFLETVDEKHEYQVFLTNTKQGGELYVEKEDGYFIVNGPSNASFDWVIYARQKGYAANRLENIERVRPVNDIDKLYYSLANAYDPSIDESVSKYLEQYESEVSGYYDN